MTDDEAKAVGEAISADKYCVEGLTSAWNGSATWEDIFTGSLKECRSFIQGVQSTSRVDSYYTNFRVVLHVCTGEFDFMPIVVEQEDA